VLAACILFAMASSVFAYPNELAGYTGDEPRTECVDCHSASEVDILNPGSDPELIAATRKGPHGGYTTGTSKCQTCHSLHSASVDGTNLLPGETIKNTCESCHDGTGGTAVYGVIKARTGLESASAHRIEQTSTIPGGAAGGGSLTGSFMGPGGTLTCSDCHSPHDTETVEPFTGDRLRSSVASDTAYAVKTNRLLRQAPTGSETTATAYGAGWCATCHAGRLVQHGPDAGPLEDHPVMQDDTYTYDNLPVVTGVGALTTTLGALGQSNRGYVMPGPTLSEPTQKTALQEGAAPLCQQCHEDKRDTGPTARFTNPTLKNAGQEFLVTQPDGLSATDNPRFQVFPHESDAENLVVREPAPTEPWSLCLNCHSLVHDATPGSGYVEVFNAKHDSASYNSDGITAACTTCHVAKLLPVHDNQCVTCHSSPYDTLGGAWANGCQQGGCHATYHGGPYNAHWDAYDNDSCETCHPWSTWWPTTTQCMACHASPSSVAAPVTTSNALASYTGAGRIDFQLTKGGKAAIGTTYYRLDGGATIASSSALVSTPGTHTIEFWSVDQNGLTEAPHKFATFAVTSDVTPPVTTSNAQTTYYQSAYITLTAVDTSTAGVKQTNYRLNGGATKTGTAVSVPGTPGTIPYTLQFWSEDWSGNVEATKTVIFTVISGTATIRLVWGDSDTTGPPSAGSWASWTVRRIGPSGPIVPGGTGSGTAPPWDGVDDIIVPVAASPYFVRIDWTHPPLTYDDQTDFANVYATVPGQVIRLSY